MPLFVFHALWYYNDDLILSLYLFVYNVYIPNAYWWRKLGEERKENEIKKENKGPQEWRDWLQELGNHPFFILSVYFPMNTMNLLKIGIEMLYSFPLATCHHLLVCLSVSLFISLFLLLCTFALPRLFEFCLSTQRHFSHIWLSLTTSSWLVWHGSK